MTTLWQDIRYGVRMLAKNRGFTAIALVTLAIGIGANTIMFSIVNLFLFRPVQVKEPDRLVGCSTRDVLHFISYETYLDIRADNPAFSEVVATDWGLGLVTMVWGDITKRAHTMQVSSNYFSTLGVAPARGRFFSPEEERMGAEAIAILSHHLWELRGADPEIVGQLITLNGTPFRIIGVAPKGFTGTSLVGPDLWLPLGSTPHLDARNTDYPLIALVGRLRPGLSMAAAQVRLQSLVPRLKSSFPKAFKRGRGVLRLYPLPRLTNGGGEHEREGLSVASLFLMGVSGVVLLIACLNLANMVVVQGSTRHREMAIRMAIGGGRLRVVRQLLIESLLLSLLGGVCGLILAFWGTRLLNAWIVAMPMPLDIAGASHLVLDVRVLTATLGFCLLATLLFGLKPALRLSRRDLITDLKESGREMTRSPVARRRFLPRGVSVVGQIALSVMLMMGAILFTRSSLYVVRLNPADSLRGKVLVEIAPRATQHDPARSMQACETLTERLGAVPGVKAVAWSSSFPFGDGAGICWDFREYTPAFANDDSETPRRQGAPACYDVGVDYTKAMALPLLQGRAFHPLDMTPGAERVAIIDEQLARKLRPDGNALGCLIQYSEWKYFEPPCRVVGIVPHLRVLSDDRLDRAQFYVPMTPSHMPTYIHLLAAVDNRQAEAAVFQAIRAEVRQVTPDLPVLAVTTLAACCRDNFSVWLIELGAKLAAAFGIMALFLASLGIYAVKGYMVASRTPEIGIRKALGATHWDIMQMVFREGLVLTVVGLILGLAIGLGVARLIASLLYGVEPVDPVSIAATVFLLAAVSLLAGYIPARRAAKVDPMVALRHE